MHITIARYGLTALDIAHTFARAGFIDLLGGYKQKQFK